MYTGCHSWRNKWLDANSHIHDNAYRTWTSIMIMYIGPMQIYNGMYIEVCHSKQGNFGHRNVNQCWSTKDQRVEKVNNWSVQSWIIEVNPQLYAGMESYKVVETILEQLRPFLIHAKRKEDLRMMQKIISKPHNFDSSLTFNDINQNHLLLHCFSHVKHCTVNRSSSCNFDVDAEQHLCWSSFFYLFQWWKF